jgi:pilus assembly protein Flp/PilA
MRNTTLKLYLRMQRAKSALRDLATSTQGQDLVEYALVVAMLAGAAAAGMTTIAIKINQVFVSIGTKLSAYTS